MRQAISVLLLGFAGFGFSMVLERYVTALPEWAWRTIGLASVAVGLIGACLTDTGYSYLRGTRQTLIYATFAAVFALFGLAVFGLVVRPLLDAAPPHRAATLGSAGNLKERTLTLADEIMDDLLTHGWGAYPLLEIEDRHRRRPVEIEKLPSSDNKQESMEWNAKRANHFRALHLQLVIGVRDEFVMLHERDQGLDLLLDAEIKTGDHYAPQPLAKQTGVLKPQALQEIAKRLRLLAHKLS